MSKHPIRTFYARLPHWYCDAVFPLTLTAFLAVAASALLLFPEGLDRLSLYRVFADAGLPGNVIVRIWALLMLVGCVIQFMGTRTYDISVRLLGIQVMMGALAINFFPVLIAAPAPANLNYLAFTAGLFFAFSVVAHTLAEMLREMEKDA